MKHRLRFFGCLAALFVFGAMAAAEPLRFSATGCGPYKPDEESLLARYVDKVSGDGQSAFLLHLGDIVTGIKKAWPESQYEKVAGILKKSKTPVYVVLGDNEWNDLDNPDLGLKFWTRHFLHFEKNFAPLPAIDKQDVRPENMAWVEKGVLMVGINLPGGRVHDKKEWDARLDQNDSWVRSQLERRQKEVRAAVVFAQATPAKTHDRFFKPFAEAVRAFGKPVLYLHADGHVWQVEKKYLVPNLVRVQTDQVSKGPPVLVTVTDDAAEPFVFDRRLEWKPAP